MIMYARSPFRILAASTFMLCAACGSAPERTAGHHEAPVYQTGSAIPVRDRSGMFDVKSADPESLRQELNGATRPQPVGNKGL
jgi:hypothetical protein